MRFYYSSLINLKDKETVERIPAPNLLVLVVLLSVLLYVWPAGGSAPTSRLHHFILQFLVLHSCRLELRH